MKSSVSIALFFLLSGFFLAVLLGAIEHSRKLLAIAGGCLAAVVCIIVFLTPVQLPSWHLGSSGGDSNAAVGITTSSTAGATATTAATATTTTTATTATTGATYARPH